jgi:uncharacterized protein (TIGR03083 family)
VSTSIENLAVVWASLESLCAGLAADDWARPTGCPGWTVQDQLSHLIDYESRALGRPGPVHDPGALAHVRNDLGRGNEVGVDFRRARSGPEVLAEFRSVVGERLAQLRALTDDDLATPMVTPAGPGTMADMLTLRVMDSWSHEQDIRRAVGRPGHVNGPAVDEAVAYFARLLPFVVGKRAGAPEGSTVVFRIEGQQPVVVEVVEGRGRLATGQAGSPTATLSMPATTFAALVGGRSDVPDDVVVTGDADLGRRVVSSMGLMP